jgi:hypothetical protein
MDQVQIGLVWNAENFVEMQGAAEEGAKPQDVAAVPVSTRRRQ